MYLAGTVAIGRYFYKKRARAMGTSLCGAGVGMFLFTPLVRFITDKYTWRGSMFILAGISLNGCVLSALLRPIDLDVNLLQELEEVELNSDVQDNELDIHSVHEITDIPMNGKVLCSIDDVNDTTSIESGQSKTTNGHLDTLSHNGGHIINGNIQTGSGEHETENGEISVVVPLMNSNGGISYDREIIVNGHVIRSPSPQHRTFAQLRKEQLDPHRQKHILGSQRSLKSVRSVNMSVLSQSIFGSNASFEYMYEKRARSKLSLKSAKRQETLDDVKETSHVEIEKFGNSLIESVFPKQLIKNINFQLMMLVCLFAGVPAFIPYSMLPDLAQTAGASPSQSAWTLSAIGVGGKEHRCILLG